MKEYTQEELEAKFATLPTIVKSQLLCINRWSPENDAAISTGKYNKLELLRGFYPQQVAPTSTNNWIWFGGCNGGVTRTPRYKNKSVICFLYEHFFEEPAPACPKSYRTSKMDVNPFKIYESFYTTKKLPVMPFEVAKEKLFAHRRGEIDSQQWRVMNRSYNKMRKLVRQDIEKFYMDNPGQQLTYNIMVKRALEDELYNPATLAIVVDEILEEGINFTRGGTHE